MTLDEVTIRAALDRILEEADLDEVPPGLSTAGAPSQVRASRRRAAVLAAAGVLVAASVGLGAVVVTRERERPAMIGSSGPDGAADRVSVGVGDGTEAIAGTYSTEEEAARRERTRRAALAWVERGPGRDDPRVDQLVNEYLDALLVLDPLEVLDDDGELVGYWAEEFIPSEEYEERRAEAAATIERLEGS